VGNVAGGFRTVNRFGDKGLHHFPAAGQVTSYGDKFKAQALTEFPPRSSINQGFSPIACAQAAQDGPGEVDAVDIGRGPSWLRWPPESGKMGSRRQRVTGPAAPRG
jgi:hypothetical protein